MEKTNSTPKGRKSNQVTAKKEYQINMSTDLTSSLLRHDHVLSSSAVQSEKMLSLK